MSYPLARIEADGLEPLAFDHETGFCVTSIDLGDAATRAVAEDAPGADGTLDRTEHIGARVITVALSLVPGTFTKEQMRNRLRAFTHPRLRPVLYLTLDDEPERRVTLRRGQFTNVIQTPGFAPVAVQWVAPLGILESAEEHVVTAQPSTGTTEGGRQYDRNYDKTYSAVAATISGLATATNAGTADAYPVLRIYGPCTDPVVEHVDQGRSLVFDSLTIAAGDFVEVDTRAKTVRLNGPAGSSLYDKLVPESSAWWALSPGDNVLRFDPATSSAPSSVAVHYRDAWL